jgi:hypothetical protein
MPLLQIILTAAGSKAVMMSLAGQGKQRLVMLGPNITLQQTLGMLVPVLSVD